MLISKILEGEERDERREGKVDNADHSHEYQTAGELFEIMSIDQSIEAKDENSLTPGDLVVLYKNNDKVTKLMSKSNQFMSRKPNQYVETVIYNEDPESDGSDVSDVYTAEELRSILSVNKERIDFLRGCLSFDKNLCQKFGGVDIQGSNLTTEYNKHFLFHDSYIKNQLNSLNVGFSQLEGALLPPSLMDYICCKRLEENYNFYMDNVITYVKHTIEQLKRISNGEYLTDKTKEKWKEVDKTERNKCTKVLATSTSIPFHIERKSNGHVTTWNDLIHSEVDVRYLSKVLEKQIIIQVPKLICDSYKLFSKRYADSLIICCKKGNQRAIEDVREEDNASRVDLVFRLQKTQSGHMMGNINSIMIVQIPPKIKNNYAETFLPLSSKEMNEATDKKLKITEICKDEEDNPNTDVSTIDDVAESKNTNYFGDYEETQCDSLIGTNDYPHSDNDCNIFKDQSYSESSQSTDNLRNSLNSEPLLQGESVYNIVSSDDVTLTMDGLNMNMCLPEESEEESFWPKNISKKKSPTRIRIKSPYENRSHIFEEKKRKRLLEIRERREKKKQALSENCKINKHKYPKGILIPQPSSSVTKLSITNKSFYNSIYGQASSIKNKQEKVKDRLAIKKDSIPEVPLDEICADGESQPLSNERNSEQYINNNCYLDDAETEVTYVKMNKEDNCEMEECSASTSVVSSDFRNNLKLLSHILSPSVTNLHKEDVTTGDISILNEIDDKKYLQTRENGYTLPNVENKVPANSLTNVLSDNKHNLKRATSSTECRKSIDKIYSLINKIGNTVNDEKLEPKNKSMLPLDAKEDRESSTIQGSDSGTSVKHHLTSSNPSYFSFGKTKQIKPKGSTVKKPLTPIVPKVIISTKSQSLKSDIEKFKKNKKSPLYTLKPDENPLKAISQLLHDIDNVQKTRHKDAEPKNVKKSEPILSEVKNGSRQGTGKRRFDQYLKDSQFQEKNIVTATQPRKPKSVYDISKLQHQQSTNEKDKINERLITDIIDEAKEARGEAVRGPPKSYSRLNSLAQPKKSYVQAHSEEYHTKYGKNLMAERLQRLAKNQSTFLERKAGSANARIRLKKSGTEATTLVSAKPAPVPISVFSARRPASTNSKEKPLTLISPLKNASQTTETLKKTAPVEMYVKDHNGHASLPNESDGGPPLDHISRIPLLPNDIDLISVTSTSTVEKSNELGNKLHCIIDNLFNRNTSTLVVPSKCLEINSKKSKHMEEVFFADSISNGKEHVSEEFDFPVDPFEDSNITTAVVENNEKAKEINKDSMNCVQPEVDNFTKELAEFENVLYRQIPVGTFQKRLRIKNLTLTPKHSMKASFSQESGDVTSLALKSSLSQNFTSFCYDKLADLKAFPVLSKSDFDWNFVKFPMQIATIGYAFPEYSVLKMHSNLKLNCFPKDVKKSSNLANIKTVCIQCSETAVSRNNERPTVKIEHAVQVDIKEKSAIPKTNPRNYTIKENKVANVDDVTNPVLDTKAETIQLVSDGVIKPLKKINDVSIDYTTSLDMLVGLLNEIQKISTCQTHITKADCNKHECKEMDTIMNTTATLEKHPNDNRREIVSITSLDKLESSPSIYTFYFSSKEEHDNSVNKSKANNIYRPIYEDKEVYADFYERETVNRFTDVPSIFPITINHSTNVTNSLIGVLSEPSSQSLFSSYAEHKSINSNNCENPQKMIIELPRPMTNDKWSRQSLVSYEKNIHLRTNLQFTASDAKQEKNSQDYIENVFKDMCHKNHKQDYNSSIKMKRDILVTVYSILVFTVFAALSFPELMYRV